MKRRRTTFFILFAIVLLLAACVPVEAPATTATESAPASGWQTYTNAEAGFRISIPPAWSQQTLPDQADGAIHGMAFTGAEGGVEVYWGTGFGGACPMGTVPVQVAGTELPACYVTNADGTESWSQIGYQVEGGNSFSVDAYTSNAERPSRELVLQVLSTLTFMPPAETADPLPAWNPGAAKTAILDFVAEVTDVTSSSYVPPADRIAVFDNDGTLWTEQPIPVQAAFLFARIAQMAPDHPEWQTTQPYQAVLEQDVATLANLSPAEVEQLIFTTHAGMTEAEFEAAAAAFLAAANHPRFGVPYTATVYQPMLELLAYLQANDFKTFIVSGGGVEFMRVFAEEVYRIPRENVVGSSLRYAFQETPDGSVLVRQPEMDSFDDKAEKPANIQLHIGRRPIVAVGNSNGDLEMLQYTGGRSAAAGDRQVPYLNLLLAHDDAEREYDYVTNTDEARAAAAQNSWVIVGMQKDFKTVFP